MPTIGNTSLPYYSAKTAMTSGVETKTLAQNAEPITVLKADPPPSVELQETPKLDLKSEIQKPQGVNLESLQAAEKAPTQISSFNATELKELQSLGSNQAIEGIEYGSEAPETLIGDNGSEAPTAISQLSSSLALQAFEDSGTLHSDTDQVAVNINNSHRTAGGIQSFEDTGTMFGPSIMMHNEQAVLLSSLNTMSLRRGG